MPNVGVIDVVAIFRSECPRDVSAFVISVEYFAGDIRLPKEFGCAFREPPAESASKGGECNFVEFQTIGAPIESEPGNG